MKRKIATLFLVVASIGSANAGEVSSTPSILNSINEKSVEFMLTDKRSSTRGEVFFASWNKSARTKAEEWCRGRGVCWVKGGRLVATGIDPKRNGRIITKSY